MSFKARTITEKLPKNDDSSTDSNVSNLFNQWDFRHAKVSLLNFPSPFKYKDYIDFEILDMSSMDIVLKYKKITTDGPIVGFCGYYLDLSSGYIVMGDTKSNEFIGLFDYYKFLFAEFGVSATPDLMKSLIERFKIGDIGLNDMVYNLNVNESVYQGHSIIGAFLDSMQDENNTDSDVSSIPEVLTPEYLVEPFKFITAFFDTMDDIIIETEGDSSVLMKNNHKHLTQLGKAGKEGAVEFFNSYTGFRRLFKKLSYLDLDINDYNSIEMENYNQIISSMPHNFSSDIYIEPYRIKEILNTTDTDKKLMNMVDMVDSYEDTDVQAEFDNLIGTANDAVSVKMIHSVVDKIGVKEYLTGRKLAPISKRFRNYKGDLQRYINKVSADSYELSSLDMANEEKFRNIEDTTVGFRKNLKLVKGALSLVRQNIR